MAWHLAFVRNVPKVQTAQVSALTSFFISRLINGIDGPARTKP